MTTLSTKCRPEHRRYRCLGCGFESVNELDAENHQVICDNAMEIIKEILGKDIPLGGH